MNLKLAILSVIASFTWGLRNAEEGAEFVFHKEYVGVEFSPYVNARANGSIPALDSYTPVEIKEMLRLVSTKFKRISTPSMGVNENNVNKTWNETDSICHVATAAALLNKENGSLLITVSQGIRISGNSWIRQRETENAFLSTQRANEIFPGTVWGLTFNIESATAGEVFHLYEVITDLKKVAAGVQIGARPPTCDSASSKLRWTGLFLPFTQRFLSVLDYLVCVAKSSEADMLGGPKYAAEVIGHKYKDIIVNTREVIYGKRNTSLPTVILVGVGWPSVGPTDSSTIQNLQTYWTEVGQWASRNKVLVHMFEAFDQPYRGDFNIRERNDSGGRFGTEAHFGWWRRMKVNNSSIYVEKIFEPQREFEPEAPENLTSSTADHTLLLSILIPILVLIGGGFALLIYKITVAKDSVGRLTDSEIRVFKEGSHVVVSGTHATSMEEKTNNLPYNSTYEIPKSSFEIDREIVLGQGAYGLVFKGKAQVRGHQEAVAFKTTKSAHSTQQLKSLLSELKLMIYVGNHPNIARLVGAYTAEIQDGIAYIAVEFCAKGSLENLLRRSLIFRKINQKSPPGTLNSDAESIAELNAEADTTEESISISQLNQWAFQTAKGMQYLAAKKVIHGDLATRNVLIASDDTVRITDFGLSRRLYEYTQYIKTSQEPLPWRWMAIESLTLLQFSSQSDVWSYGVTIWEIYSMGDVPYPGLSWDVNFVEKLKEGLRMSAPKFATEIIFQKMLQCWDSNRDKRPTFDNLVDFFNPWAMECTYLTI